MAIPCIVTDKPLYDQLRTRAGVLCDNIPILIPTVIYPHLRSVPLEPLTLNP